MSIAYSGNYEPSIYNPSGTPNPVGAQKRYKMHFQKGVPLSSNELDEIQEISDAYIRQLITINFPAKENPADANCKCYSTNDGFKITQSSDPVNNFLIKGGNGTFEGAGILIVDGYILFLKNDLEYKDQGYSTGTLVDDKFTRTWPAAPALTPPATFPRIDVVYIDFYFAEVSGTGSGGTGISTSPPEYKDTSLIVPGIGFSTANRMRMVQDVCVIAGTEAASPTTPSIPIDGPDANGIYHRFVKIATITRSTSSNITTSMIADNRILINSLSSYSTGNTITDLVLASGQDIGSASNRIGSIYMASIIDYATDLRFLSSTEKARFTTTGRLGIGTTNPQAGIQVTGQTIRIDATSPELDFYDGGTSLCLVKGTTGSLDLEAVGSREINFITNATERAVILPGGNVGIGTTNPQQLLHVQGNCLVTNDLIINGSSNFTSMAITGKLAVTQAANDNGIVVSQTGAGNNATVMQINNAGTGASLLVSAGRVGIGVTNPSATLHVGGDVIVDNNMTVNGTTTIINTEVTAADMLEINQNDNQVALAVNQTLGSNTATVMTIHNAGTGYSLLIDTGRVGIGTATPQKLLHLEGDMHISGGIYKPTDLSFFLNNVELFKMTSAGRLGINTTTPQVALDVVGSGVFSQDLGVSGNTYINGNLGIGTATPSKKLDVAGDIALTGSFYKPASDLTFIFNNNERFRMSQTGNLGIGNTNPQYAIHCQGSACFNTVGGSGVFITGESGTVGKLTTDGSTLKLQPTPVAPPSSALVELSASLGQVNISAGTSYLNVQGYDANRNVRIGGQGIDFTILENNGLIQMWSLAADSDMITTTHHKLQIATASNGNYSGILNLDATAGQCDINAGADGNINFYGNRTYIRNTGSDPSTSGGGIVFYGQNGLVDHMWSYGTILDLSADKNGTTSSSARISLNAYYGSTEIFGGANSLSVYSSVGDGGNYVDLIDLNAPKIRMHGSVAITPDMSYSTEFAALNITPAGTNDQSGINFFAGASISAGTDLAGATNPHYVALCGGRYPNSSWGASVYVEGNDIGGAGQGGWLYLRPGNTANAAVRCEGTMYFAGDNIYYYPSGSYFNVFSSATTLNIESQVASNNGTIQISHGLTHGVPSSSYGAFASFAGSGAGSRLELSAGLSGSVTLTSYSDMTLTSSGDMMLDANGNDIVLTGRVFVNTPPVLQTQARINSDTNTCSLEIYRQNGLGGDVLRVMSNVTSPGNVVAKIDVYGQYFSDAGTTVVTPASDFAEWNTVVGDISNYGVGTVVQQSFDEDMKVNVAADDVYGIVTDRATFCGGFASTDIDPEIVKQDFKTLKVEELETKYNAKRIAMTGHVLCKVVGYVARGQRLVLSEMPGVARAATSKQERLESFAIARQSYNSEKPGLIEVRL